MIKINNEEEHPEEKLKEFIGSVVSPVGFSKIELSDNTHEMVITAGGKQNKAGLIGRNRTREQELKGILEEFFNIHRLRIA